MDIKVYSRTNCAPCQMLKHWLDSNDIKYDLIDIEQDPDGFASTGSMMVPTTVIDGQVVIGPNISIIKKLLDK